MRGKRKCMVSMQRDESGSHADRRRKTNTQVSQLNGNAELSPILAFDKF